MSTKKKIVLLIAALAGVAAATVGTVLGVRKINNNLELLAEDDRDDLDELPGPHDSDVS